jgi:hypothetical protein
MANLKNEFELQTGVKFSKNGLIEHIKNLIATETNKNKDDPINAKKWNECLTTPGIKFLLKKGGSEFNASQPYLRTESTFNQKWKMEKIINCIYSPEHLKKWDKNIAEADFTPITPGKRSYGLSYNSNKK